MATNQFTDVSVPAKLIPLKETVTLHSAQQDRFAVVQPYMKISPSERNVWIKRLNFLTQ